MLYTTPHHNRFTALFTGPPGWAGSRKLLDFTVQGKINRGRHTNHPAGRHSIRTNQCPPSSPHFYTGCSSNCNPPTLSWLGTGIKYAGLHTQWLGSKHFLEDHWKCMLLYWRRSTKSPWIPVSHKSVNPEYSWHLSLLVYESFYVFIALIYMY